MIRKLPSGKWRIQAHFTVNGKVYRPSFTANTKSECNYWLAEQKIKFKNYHPVDTTVRSAIEKYIDLAETLSPTTKNAYQKILAHSFTSIMDRSVDDLTDADMQQAINMESKRTGEKTGKQISAKTVSNEWGLLASSLKLICGKTYNVRLPKRTKILKRYPHPEELIPLLKGTSIEIPCLMAMMLSLRMSETRGARYSSIKDGYLYIDQVKICIDGIDQIKPMAKTYDSNRRVKIPNYLLQLIENSPHTSEYIVDLTQNQLAGRTTRFMRQHGYDITYHSLRHLFASTGAMLGIQPIYLADFGGWSNTKVLEDTYEELFDSEKSKAEYALSNYFDSLSEKFCE